MRIKAQAVVAAIVAIGIGPAELSFAGQDASPSKEALVEAPQASIMQSRTQVRRTFIDARTRIVRTGDQLDRLDRVMAMGGSLRVS